MPLSAKRLAQIAEREERLVAIYKDAYMRLLETIARKSAKGSMAVFERSLLADVQRILESLGVDMKQWVEQDLPQIYRTSAEAVYEAFITAGIDLPPFSASFAKVNESTVRVLADNMNMQLTKAHNMVARRVASALRDTQLELVTQKLTTGMTVRQVKQAMVARMSEEGFVAFEDIRGRRHRLDSYSEMVARTVTREATNAGMMDQLQAMGRDLVQMSTHFATCDICAPYAGRVYTLTGSTPGYPKLSVVPGFDRGYKVVHPNCRHVLQPYVEELADDPQGDKDASNRPFSDKRSRRQVEAYEAAQDKKSAAARDMRQYQAMKTLLPNDAPKSFSGFRRMKAANSDRYQELKVMEREAKAASLQQ